MYVSGRADIFYAELNSSDIRSEQEEKDNEEENEKFASKTEILLF